MDITRAEMGPIVLSPAAVDEIVAVLALIPLMSMNLRAKLDDEVVVTDASPSGGGAAVATRFKRDPDTIDYSGDVCLECEGAFGNWGRFPCPANCGGVFCSLHCIHTHRNGACVRRSYPCPRFGERFSGPHAPLSHAVAKRGGIEVQEPFDWYLGHDFFNQEDKQRLENMENDPLLGAEHWAPECKPMSRARDPGIGPGNQGSAASARRTSHHGIPMAVSRDESKIEKIQCHGNVGGGLPSPSYLA